MKHTYKQKIEILNSILIEYAKYFIYFDECKCYDVGLRFFIIFRSNGKTRYKHLTRKIPRDQIDVVIARYRSKLSYELEKNELKMKVNDAILELEFKNKLKSIMI